MPPARTPWPSILYVALVAQGCTSVTLLDEESQGSTSDRGTTTSFTTSPTATATPTTANPSASSAGTTTSEGGDTSSSDAGDGCTFLGCDSDTPPIAACNFWDDDCPRGEKCTFWANDGGNSWNSTRCVPLADDPAGPDEPCVAEGSGVSGFDNCEAGSMCWDIDAETLEGTCIPFCVGNRNAPTCDDPQRYCSISGGPLALCVQRCHPLDPDGCGPGQGCYPAWNTTTCAPDASGANAGGAFEACEFINGCSAGLFCTSPDAVGACQPGGTNCCTPWCDLEAPDCPDPTTCIPAYGAGDVPEGQENVGFCGQAT